MCCVALDPAAVAGPMTSTVRVATREDLPFLRRMLFEAAFWRPESERPGIDEGLRRSDLAPLLEGWGRAGDTAVVAESGRHVPLGAAWYRTWSDAHHSYGYVDATVPELGIGVRADARGRGVGSQLLRALLERAAADGVARVSLSVELDNPAVRLYQRLGFRPVARVGGAWTMVVDVGGASAP